MTTTPTVLDATKVTADEIDRARARGPVRLIPAAPLARRERIDHTDSRGDQWSIVLSTPLDSDAWWWTAIRMRDDRRHENLDGRPTPQAALDDAIAAIAAD